MVNHELYFESVDENPFKWKLLKYFHVVLFFYADKQGSLRLRIKPKYMTIQMNVTSSTFMRYCLLCFQ